MRLEVNGDDIFVSTGGRRFDAGGSVLLFIHGSGQTHLSWILQARFFANRGWQVLAPDLPGHGLSGGEARVSVESVAQWCADFLSAAGVSKAAVIGHSQGGLVALELARHSRDKITHLAIIASGLSIPVSKNLLALAATDEAEAIHMMVSWGHGKTGHRHDHTMPGQSHLLYGQQVMGLNKKGTLLIDLNACNNYKDGEQAATSIKQPALVVLAANDRMVPPKNSLSLTQSLADCNKVIVADAGHFVQSEKPLETNIALRQFLMAGE